MTSSEDTTGRAAPAGSPPDSATRPVEPEAAPAVVAVVVTCNAGPWFTETLEALRDQDYPNLSVLIIDAASADDPLERIVDVLPTAYVRRLSRNPGYAAASNRVLRILQGASYLVMCHDDVAPAPDAIRKMVEEAYRTNAGVVTPKMVEWLRPDHLSALGGGADTTGAFIPAVEPGDLDQGQHDGPSEVFVAPGGCMLVRADLFTSLGGFDAAMTLHGEDIDFSWRAHVVGARVVTASSARVRHLAAASNGLRLLGATQENDDDETHKPQVFDELVLRRRHRLRTALKVQRRFALALAIVQLAAISIGEIIFGLVTGKTEHSSSVIAAWTWNIAHWRDLGKLRRQLQKFRTVDDREIRSQLSSTRKRVEELLFEEWEQRSQRRRSERAERSGRDFVGALRNLPVAVWATVVVIWLLGSRHLLTGAMPAVGQIVPLLNGPVQSIRQFSGSMPSDAWGTATTQSPAYLIFAILSAVFFGAVGVLHRVLILGMLPIGVWGAARMARPLKSPRARLIAVLAYAAVPVPYDSLALGRWDGLVGYACAPFVLVRLLRAVGATPYVDHIRQSFVRSHSARYLDDEDFEMLVLSETIAETDAPASTVARMRAASAQLAERSQRLALESELTDDFSTRQRFSYLFLRRVLPLGLTLAVVGLVVPQILFASLTVAFALAASSLVTRFQFRQSLGVLFMALAGAAIAVALNLPAIIGTDAGWRNLWQSSLSSAAPTGFGALLRLAVGGHAASVATYGLLITALPGLVIGNSWRFGIALRIWIVTLTTVVVTWAGAHSWLGPVHPDAHIFLAFAGASLALNSALGVVALQEDLRSHQFGWRQAMPFVAVCSVLVAIIPVASRAGSGSWQLPSISNSQLLSWMNQQQSQGSFRVLWLGDGDAMPGGARRISSDLSAAVAVNGASPRSPGLPSSGGRGQKLLATDIAVARRGDTVDLGKLLAPYSVRYIVIPNRTGAVGSTGQPVPPPPGLVSSLSSQLDLQLVDTDDSITVYQNNAYLPVRSALSPAAVLAAHSNAGVSLQSDDVSAVSVLPNGGGRAWRGGLAPEDVYVSEANSSAWTLRVNGHKMARQRGFDWANTFSVGARGSARLLFSAPTWVSLVQLIDGLAWLITVFAVVKYRTRRGRWA